MCPQVACNVAALLAVRKTLDAVCRMGFESAAAVCCCLTHAAYVVVHRGARHHATHAKVKTLNHRKSLDLWANQQPPDKSGSASVRPWHQLTESNAFMAVATALAGPLAPDAGDPVAGPAAAAAVAAAAATERPSSTSPGSVVWRAPPDLLPYDIARCKTLLGRWQHTSFQPCCWPAGSATTSWQSCGTIRMQYRTIMFIKNAPTNRSLPASSFACQTGKGCRQSSLGLLDIWALSAYRAMVV